MLNQLAEWLDDRTGYLTLVRTFSEEQIQGGARWRYVFGSTLASVFLIQAVTGVLMMTAYSPSSASAWGSVYYINNIMWMGWFIRGLHHFGASTVMVLLVFHLLQVVLAGAYRKPREVNWWFGLALLVLTVSFGHTGYQLPWDQKGYWATKVMTNIMGGAPLFGPYLKTIVVGGTEYGNQTITRLYGLHVAILPILMILCLWAHVMLARRHGLTPPARPERWAAETYWPAQTFRNVAFLSIVVGIMVSLDLIKGGAPLDAPADPSSSDYPARPEWFFLCLFQMLKHFPGRLEWVGSIVIPSTILLFLFLLPLLDRILPSRFLHFLACAGVFGLLGGAGYLTVEALKVRRGRPAVSGSQAEGRCGPRAGTFPRGEPRGRHPAGRSRVPAAARPANPRACRSGEEVPGLPFLWRTGHRRADRGRPQGLRLPHLGSRPAREPRGDRLFRQGPQPQAE